MTGAVMDIFNDPAMRTFTGLLPRITVLLLVALGLSFVLRLRERQGDKLLRFRIVGVDPSGGVTLVWATLPP